MNMPDSHSPAHNVNDFIMDAVASILSVGREEVSPAEPLFDLGMTSLQIVDLGQRIEDGLGVPLDAASFFEYNTCERIILHLTKTTVPEPDAGTAPWNDRGRSASPSRQTEVADNPAIPDRSGFRAEDVAVVGASCLLPGGVTDLHTLWNLLDGEQSAIGRLPLNRWSWPNNIDPLHQHPGIDYGGFVNDVSSFDAHFFRISPKEASFMDPQQRLLLQLAWACLEDACYTVAELAASHTGVFVGATGSDYRIRLIEQSMMQIDGHFHQGSSNAILPNRLSYFFNWKGPSLEIETACSSSLVAMHEAVKSLYLKECDQAMVAGVNVMCHASKSISFYKAGMLSRDGKCKTFDKRADGYVRGEGAVALLLKRLPDAVRDGDRIHCVIKGTAVNHGGEAAGLTVPNPAAQAELVQRAIKAAGIHAADISYVEAHGTGTSLGDPIEVRGLKEAFRSGGQNTAKQCGLGSIKTNFGHLEAAAGLTGVLKVLVAMKHKTIPATLNFRELNPHISLENSPFYIVDKARPWLLAEGQTTRYAGVNSFGAGGVNAHIVMQEYVPPAVPLAPSASSTRPALVLFSARSKEALNDRVYRMLSALSSWGWTDEDLPSIAYSSQVGREAMEHRLGVVVSTLADLTGKLRALIAGQKNIGHLYQGEVKLHKESLAIFDNDEEIEEAVQKWVARGKLPKILELWVWGFPVKWSMLYPNATPALTELPTYPFKGETYWLPDLPHTEANREQGAPGYLHPLLHVNTSNLETQQFSSWLSGKEFFLAGHVIRGRKVLPGVAYLEMARAAVERSTQGTGGRTELRGVVWQRPLVVEDRSVRVDIQLRVEEQGDIRYEISSSSEAGGERVVHAEGHAARWNGAEVPLLDLSRLQRSSAAECVAGGQCYEQFAQFGLHYGAGHRSVRRLWVGQDEMGKAFVLGELELPAEVAASAADYGLHPGVLDGALQASLALRMGGSGEKKKPGLPFAVERVVIYGNSGQRNWVWVREAKGSGEQTRKLDIDVSNEQGEIWIQLEGFSDRAVGGGNKQELETDRGVLLVERVWEDAEALPETSQETPAELVVLLCGTEKEKEELAAELPGASGLLVEASGKTGEVAADYAATARRTMALVQQQMRQRGNGQVLLQVVAHGGDASELILGLWGLIRTAQLENPRLIPQVISVEKREQGRTLAALLRENQRWGEAGVVRYRSGRREIAQWKEIAQTSSAGEQASQRSQGATFHAGGVYLITGGAGGLGLLFAEEVSTLATGARIALMGRSPLKEAAAKRLDEIRAKGAEVRYWQADICDRDAVAEMIGQIHLLWGPIEGVIHSAGVIQDGFLFDKRVEELEAVLGPKVRGLVQLDEVLRDEKLDFFVFFSSGTGSWGNVGQGDYAAANGFMDAYAGYRTGKVRSGERWGKTVSIGWPLWQDGGMKRQPRLVEQMREQFGTEPLTSNSGVAAFFDAISSGRTHVVLVNGDRRQLRQTFLGNKKQPQQSAVQPVAAAVRLTVMPTPSEIDTQAGHYFKKLLAGALKVEPGFIESDEPFADYGLDSIMVMEIIHELEKEFGSLTKTLLFEYTTIDTLVPYFVETHKTALYKVLGFAPNASRPLQEKENEKQSPDVRHRSGGEEIKTPPGRSRWRPADGPQMPAPLSDFRPAQPEAPPPGLSASEVPSPQNRPGQATRDIAIIGMSGRYPQARTLEEFWENLKAGKDCISEIPAERWDYRLFFDPEKGKPGKSYSKWGGFIDGVDEFDPLFFNISPREAEALDPQVRLFLQCAYETLEDAGYTRESLGRYSGAGLESNVGVFVGVLYHEYQLFGAQSQVMGDPFALSGSGASIANRVSHFCNFHGPSMSVDTMCSSSLTAIHLAYQSLQRNECEVALAGGVNLALHPNKYLLLSQGQYISSQGRCESFGEGGDGYVPGEGVGSVLLKPLDRAIADRDRIYGVIKASAVNHGGRTNGYTVPNPNAQAAVITQALRQSGLPACAIGYVEAHGTGTKLGDPIEIAGLSKSFGPAGVGQPLCRIGSVKSNIGHAESAAGVAGLTKVLLQMKHRTLPPSLHAESLNPHIDFARTPFVVQRELMEWTRPTASVDGVAQRFPLTAGISSFGAGGANCHMIVQEHDAPQEVAGRGGEIDVAGVVVVLSARTKEQLRLQAKNLLQASLRLSDFDLPAIGYTLQVGREAMECRLGVFVQSLQILRSALEQFLAGESDIPGFHVGQVLETRDTLLTGDPYLPQSIELLLESRDYPKLLDLWVEGVRFDWERLYTDARPARIGLPTYPFAQEKYWIPSKRPAAPADPHPGQIVEKPRQPASMPTKPAAISLQPLSQAAEAPRIEPVTLHRPPSVAPPPSSDDSQTFSLSKLAPSTRGVERELAASLAEVLYMESSDVGVNKQFVDLGLDSVVGVEWIRMINRRYGLNLAAVRLYDYPTVSDLARFLVQELQAQNGVSNGDLISTVLHDIYQGKVSAGEARDLLRDLPLPR